MAMGGMEKELIGLETRYWQAMKDKDVDTALNLTDFPCLVSGPQGVRSIDRDTYESMMKKSPWQLRDFELEEPRVRLLGEDTAIVTYRVREEMMVDGAPKSIEAADSSTWVRRDGRWACAQHSEAIIAGETRH